MGAYSSFRNTVAITLALSCCVAIIEACFSSAALSNPIIKPSAQEVLKDISEAYAIRSSRIEIVDTNRFLAKCFEDADDFQYAVEARQHLLTLVSADVGINALGYACDVQGIVRDYLKLQNTKRRLPKLMQFCRTFPRLTEAFELRAEALTGLGHSQEAWLAWNDLIVANNEIEALDIGRAKLFAKVGDRKSEGKGLKRAALVKLEKAE